MSLGVVHKVDSLSDRLFYTDKLLVDGFFGFCELNQLTDEELCFVEVLKGFRQPEGETNTAYPGILYQFLRASEAKWVSNTSMKLLKPSLLACRS